MWLGILAAELALSYRVYGVSPINGTTAARPERLLSGT